METSAGLDIQYEAFEAGLQDNIALLRFNRDFLLRTTDLENRDRVLDYMDRIGRSPRVKVLIIFGSPLSKGREEFLDFFRRARQGGVHMISIQRMYNVVSQLVVRIVELEKVVIHVNSGFIIAPYLNMSLACDYRLVAEDAVIQNPCVELGMAPKGGGGYFLPRLVGRRRAYEIMLATRDIFAQEARQMGIIDELVPAEGLETTALERARDLTTLPLPTLSGVKKLINYNLNGFREYMAYENEVLLNIIRRNAAGQQLD